MSRHKKPKPGGARPTSPDPGAGPAGGAEAALAAGRFKDAIEHFKDLLKRERRPAWLEGLAAAYAGRAGQLAAKDMVKEALALWRTRAETCAVPLLDGPYVRWLIQSGQIEHALGLLSELDKLPEAAREQARSQLAPAVLVAPDHLLAGVPEDLMRHRTAARAALCAGGDETALAQALQAISFRSPYRDLRPLLKALALRASDPQQAAAALSHVPEGGPFEALAKAVRVCLLPRTEWLAGLRQLDDAGRALVLDFQGCPQAQRALVLELMAQSGVGAGVGAPAPHALLDSLLRHRRALDAGVARSLCLRLLPHAAQRLDSVRAAFAPLAVAEQERALALAAELKQRPDQAESHWLELVASLRKTPEGARRAALVLRRLADEHAHHSPEGELCVHALDWLAQSLKLDPADKATHLRLVRDARQGGDLASARKRLDAAREHFPDDVALLQEAVQVALAAGAFKKAAGLAKQVLRADPINPQVRSLIGEAHLAHARKQIQAHKPGAAQRELDEASNWLRSSVERGRLKLLQGLAAEPAAAGDALLREAVAELGGPLVGAFHLLLEGQRTRYRSAAGPADLLRRAAVDRAATPAAAQVVALAQALHMVPERDAALHSALGLLAGMLQRAASSVHLSESDHLLVCEALHRHRLADLTRRFAAAAIERWPQRPAFVYLEAAARFGAAPWTMPQREWQRLDRVFEQAQEQGDQRTAARLSKLLSGADGGPGSHGPMSDPDEIDDDEDMRAAFETMLAAGGVDAFLEVARRQLGKATFDQLRREVKGSEKEFALALVELLAAVEAKPPFEVRILPPPTGAGRNASAKPAKPATRAKTAPGDNRQPDFFDE